MNYIELAKRVAVAVIGIPLIFFLTIKGGLPFVVLIGTIQALMLWEFYGICRQKGVRPLNSLGIIAVVFLSILSFLVPSPMAFFLIPLITIVVLIVELFRGKPGPLSNAAATLLGIVYIGFFSAFILIREMPETKGIAYRDGGLSIILLWAGIWICDTIAYFFGSYFGKHALFKRVSPRKTWEGSIAGLIGALFTVYGFAKILLPAMTIMDILVIGGIIGVFSQIGDLVESLFKRDVQIKDSSHILPGHGGFLDRFDSPLLIGPLVFLYFLLSGFPG
ncbi:MAG TPA: phosphatidate cytidylyltransferase [bacterium]|nr:phosphatidate cytidylyltransferase [bacterium]